MNNALPSVIVIGAGKHANVIVEIAEQKAFAFKGFLDDHVQTFRSIPYLGPLSHISHFPNDHFLMGIGLVANPFQRMKILQLLKPYTSQFLPLVSPHAYISPTASLGHGTSIHPFALINTNAQIGNFCIINSHALVEHDVVLKDNVHIATRATVNGSVSIEANVFIGSGAIIKENLTITSNVVIGMGSMVRHSIKEPGVYAGNPLRKLCDYP